MQLRTFTIVLALAVLSTSSGCSTLVSLLAGATQRMETWQKDRAEFREAEQETRQEFREVEREALKAQREAELQERQLLVASEKACIDSRREALREQFRESVRSKVTFDVDHHLRVGQLQVDADKLKKLLEEKDKEHLERQKFIDELNKEAEAAYREELRTYSREKLRARLQAPVCGREEFRDKCDCACGTCAGKGGCDDCGKDACSCGKHHKKSHCDECKKKWHRHHCKHCDKCGGPGREPLQQLPKAPVRQEVKQPLLATEIPLMLPVSIELGMEQPKLEGAEVRKQPLVDLGAPREPFRDAPCDACGQKGCRCEAGPAQKAQKQKPAGARSGSLVPPKPSAEGDLGKAPVTDDDNVIRHPVSGKGRSVGYTISVP